MSSASPTGSRSERVTNLHRMAYLWSVEGSITRVKNPFLPKFIQAVLQLLRKQVFKVLSEFNWDKNKTKIDKSPCAGVKVSTERPDILSN